MIGFVVINIYFEHMSKLCQKKYYLLN